MFITFATLDGNVTARVENLSLVTRDNPHKRLVYVMGHPFPYEVMEDEYFLLLKILKDG